MQQEGHLEHKSSDFTSQQRGGGGSKGEDYTTQH